jgi:hypothetical protein
VEILRIEEKNVFKQHFKWPVNDDDDDDEITEYFSDME